MKVTFFIDRPVFSAVISIVIVIVGIIGLTMLPVDQYPQITPPVVKISASYPGASALIFCDNADTALDVMIKNKMIQNDSVKISSQNTENDSLFIIDKCG